MGILPLRSGAVAFVKGMAFNHGVHLLEVTLNGSGPLAFTDPLGEAAQGRNIVAPHAAWWPEMPKNLRRRARRRRFGGVRLPPGWLC